MPDLKLVDRAMTVPEFVTLAARLGAKSSTWAADASMMQKAGREVFPREAAMRFVKEVRDLAQHVEDEYT